MLISPIVAFLSLVRKGFFAGGGGCRVKMEDGIFSLRRVVVTFGFIGSQELAGKRML